jgi:hypothetical protein
MPDRQSVRSILTESGQLPVNQFRACHEAIRHVDVLSTLKGDAAADVHTDARGCAHLRQVGRRIRNRLASNGSRGSRRSADLSAGALAEVEAFAMVYEPVWPKPPAPRPVAGRCSIGSHATRLTGAITSCAMRIPGSTSNGDAPWLISSTFTSPR